MQITFLGTGTSGGIPVLTCSCEVCKSLDFRDKRLRTSVHISIEGKSYVIDTGPDFRQQALRENIKKLDAVIFTHEHKDHTAGLDDIRPYNYLNGKKYLKIFGQVRVLDQLKKEFHYAFKEDAYPGVPLLETEIISNEPFQIDETVFTPISVLHYKLPVFGYRIKDFTYITDANFISDEEIEKAKGSEVLVLNALQITKHISHFNLEEAIEMAIKIGAKKTYFTHISHKLGLHGQIEKTLPENIFLAYDGLKISM
jgi:phosphoribosyl 1,2-cyclic phosphate phosphodiesterase